MVVAALLFMIVVGLHTLILFTWLKHRKSTRELNKRRCSQCRGLLVPQGESVCLICEPLFPLDEPFEDCCHHSTPRGVLEAFEYLMKLIPDPHPSLQQGAVWSTPMDLEGIGRKVQGIDYSVEPFPLPEAPTVYSAFPIPGLSLPLDELAIWRIEYELLPLRAIYVHFLAFPNDYSEEDVCEDVADKHESWRFREVERMN
jgi:hypothetical protein